MTGRTAKGSDSRRRLIDAAIVGMRTSGLSGAGINEIARAGGAPKGSIYHLFPGGKTQIACESLQVYADNVLERFDAALSGEGRPEARVRALFEALAKRLEDTQFRQSCAAGAVCTDLVDDMEPVREAVAAAFGQWQDRIAGHCDFIADRRRARSFAGLLLSAIEGAYLRGRAERSGAAFREAGRWLSELAAQQAAMGRPARRRAPGR